VYAAACRHADQSFSLYYKEVICMTLNEFQKLLAPHTLVSLWAGPSLMLWGGEIEACDFTRYGNREITTINLYNRDYYRGFLVYLRPRG
jgi:hypothetical protein